MVENRRFRTFGLLVFTLLGIPTVSCGGGANETSSPVAAPLECPPERCVDIQRANALLDFTVLEPERVPDGFSLQSRRLVDNLEPTTAEPGNPASTDLIGPPSAIAMDFRFRGSPAIPGLSLIQTSLGPTGKSTSLSLAPGCAERVDYPGGEMYYINGSYTLDLTEDESTVLVCGDRDGTRLEVHSVVAKRGNVLIEVFAFPEVRITKEEIIDFVKSLQPAEEGTPAQ